MRATCFISFFSKKKPEFCKKKNRIMTFSENPRILTFLRNRKQITQSDFKPKFTCCTHPIPFAGYSSKDIVSEPCFLLSIQPYLISYLLVDSAYEYKHFPALIERTVRTTGLLNVNVVWCTVWFLSLLTCRFFFHVKPKNKVNVILSYLDESSFEVNNAFITQTEKDHTERHLKDDMTPQSKSPL